MATRAERLTSDANVWIALTRADGRPHLTPIWFVWVHDAIWLCTTRDSVKARIVAVRPSVSFALEDGNRPVTGEGRAELFGLDDVPSAVHAAFLEKYEWETENEPDYVMICINVSRWLSPSTDAVE